MEDQTFSLLGEVLGSTFVVSFISALIGAAAGAMGAQRIIERTQNKDTLLQELRNTNAAIMVAFMITNTTLNLKKQIVKPMQDKFDSDRTAFTQFLAERKSGLRQNYTPFSFDADFKTFFPPSIPIETLKNLIYDRISAYGRPLGLVALVEEALVGLVKSIHERDRLVAEFKLTSTTENDWIFQYFGKNSQNNQIHGEYPDIIEVIGSYTNDLLYFSAELAAELVKHGEDIRSAFIAKYGKKVPNVSSPDFSGPKQSGLFPQKSDYSSWSQWIVERRK